MPYVRAVPLSSVSFDDTGGPAMEPECGQGAAFFKRSDGVSPDAAADTLTREDDEAARERRLLCRKCGHAITSRGRAIVSDGSHVHVFTNPAGLTFRIGCFSDAPGCLLAGEPTTEFTWFPGHAWSFALCAGCGAHLGWYYDSGSGGFFGLILANLAEDFLQ